MEPISKTVSALNKFEVRGSEQRDALIKAVEEIIDVKLDKKEVQINAGVAYLKCDPIIKSEIYLQKQKILTSANFHLKVPILKIV